MRIALLLAACGGDKETPDGSLPDGADADADTDADTDADADADTDADTDTAPVTTEPECEDAPQPISEADFRALYQDKYCYLWTNACGAPPPCPAAPEPPPECAFRPEAACACLDASWACAGGEPMPAGSCGQVYACAEDTAWWTDTGRPGDSGGSGG